MILSKNSKISNYTITFPIKEGDYAETYRVKDSGGKNCFLKLINYAKLHRSQFDSDGNVIEFEIAKQLSHPNITTYRDSGEVVLNGQRFAYIVYDFIVGETVAQQVTREQRCSVYDAKQIVLGVLNALKYMHSFADPIIHNELTIQNIMLDKSGATPIAKIIDFGYARYLSQGHKQFKKEGLNPFYLAPEALNGVFSQQSDIFSVGAMLYHLLFGLPPYFVELSSYKQTQTSVEEVLEKERSKPLRIPDKDIFELDDHLISIIKKALCPNIDHRFKTAEEFINALNGEVVESIPETIVKSFSKKSNVEKHEKKGEGFAAVAGMEDLKQQLTAEVIEPLHNPEEYKRYGITIPNGMLLYGPPGCGKTFFAKHFAEEVGFNFMLITPASLKSRYVNATQENIANMFKEAEENAPTIIFIDEMNELVPNREDDVHEMSRSAVNEMLAQMDRTGEKGIFIIGATNYPHMIDPAILRAGRLDKKYYLGVPDKEARIALFELYLKNRPIDFGLDYNELAELTQNYVSADIQLIVNDAARSALKQKSKITMELLRNSISSIRSSISLSELQRFEEIKTHMEGNTQNQKRPKIGFNK